MNDILGGVARRLCHQSRGIFIALNMSFLNLDAEDGRG
jgi:hypothetical protein